MDGGGDGDGVGDGVLELSFQTSDGQVESKEHPDKGDPEQLSYRELHLVLVDAVSVAQDSFEAQGGQKPKERDPEVTPDDDAQEYPKQVHEWRLSLKGQAQH